MSRLRTAWTCVRSRAHLPVLFYAHPFELALGFVLVLSGLRAIVTAETSPSVDAALSATVLVVFQAVSGVAGLGVVIGLVQRRRVYGRTIERASLWLAAGSYLGYAVILKGSYDWPTIWINFSTTVAIGCACGLRARAIRKTELAILAALQNANADTVTAAEIVRTIVDARANLEGHGPR